MKHQTFVFITFIIIFSPLLIQASLLPSGVPPQEVFITCPYCRENQTFYWFWVYVTPSDVDLPITYTLNATDHPPMEHVGGASVRILLFWETGGVKEITVTAENAYGSVTKSMTVEVRGSYRVFIPMAVKQ